VILLGVCGSLRRGSYNRLLLGAAAQGLPREVTFQTFDGLAEIPPYHEERAPPEAVQYMRDAFAAADAILFATPEYNASVPGHLKNALDWASRPFPDNSLRERAVGVVGASTGLFGAVWAQAELRKVLKTIGARVLDEELPIGQADTAFDLDGQLRDPDQRAALAALVDQLLKMSLPAQPEADGQLAGHD
jgi:chromate reductase